MTPHQLLSGPVSTAVARGTQQPVVGQVSHPLHGTPLVPFVLQQKQCISPSELIRDITSLHPSEAQPSKPGSTVKFCWWW